MLLKPLPAVLSAVIALALPCRSTAQSRVDVAAATDSALELKGCYEIRWGKDTPDEYTGSIPHHVWLTWVRIPMDSGQTVPAFAMRPAPDYRQSRFEAERWALNGDSLILTWDNAFFGMQIVVRVSDRRPGAVWRGRTFWWTDDMVIVQPGQPAQPRRGSVSIAQVDCFKQP